MSAQTPDRGAAHAAAQDRLAAPLAVLLWIVVVAALAYGVWSTLGKVVDLFS
jgi:hypothetical protein